MHYEYKVTPAPRRGLKGKGIKGAEARFAFAIQTLMNEYAADGWEFLRAETLGAEERHGLTSAQTVYRDLLVFRRLRAVDQASLNSEPPDLAPAAPTDDVPEQAQDDPAPDDITPDEAFEASGTDAETDDAPSTFETTRRD